MNWTRVFRQGMEPKMIPELFPGAIRRLELPFPERELWEEQGGRGTPEGLSLQETDFLLYAFGTFL